MQEDGGRIKAAGKMAHEDFLGWVQTKLMEGWQIHSCYEAGASGYWLDRVLVELGVKNLVVVPKVLDQGGKKQKTDKRDRWRPQGWFQVLRHPRLKDWMKEQLVAWMKKILSAEEEQSVLRQRSAALAPAVLPKGVGAYSAAVLEYELKGFGHFQNRRQIASITGLCPGIHLSDGRGKEGSINRCGNPIVRWTLVEMVWRLMMWQPSR